MTYKMFIDDERFPPMNTCEWVEVRNIKQVNEEIEARGFPQFISFDHDLGLDEPTGFDIAKMLIDRDIDSPGLIPHDFSFYVHSQNPIGAENITKMLHNYLEFRKRYYVESKN
jgi:hypothetical protein